MPFVLPATELVAPPSSGRVVTRRRVVRLGDVDERGRLRLDATARYLQDVATDDDAETDGADGADGADGQSGWVVRRTMIDVRRAAALDEPLALSTFCSGTGRSWAERRTSIVGDRGASIEAVSLWIRIDAASGRPTGLGQRFFDVYGEAARGRRVSTRLSLAAPTPSVEHRAWPVRRVDLDPLHHVNNAAHWAIVEELLPEGSRRGMSEIEHLVPIEPDATPTLAWSFDDRILSAWLIGDGGQVLTASRFTPAH